MSSYRTGQHLARPVPNDFERAADCLEWVFYLPGLEDVVPQRVCAREVAKALDNVIRATFAQVGNPLEVKLAWQMVLDLMGPILFGHFVRMRAWKDFTPPVPKHLDTPSKHVLWVGHDKRVVLTLVYEQDVARDIRLWVEDIT